MLGHAKIYAKGAIEEVSTLHRARWVINLTHASSEVVFVPYDEAYGEGFEDNVAACA